MSIVTGVLLFLILGAGIGGPAADQVTGYYDLYVGFAAKMDCKPKEGPYLTQLSHDFHVGDLRFVFGTRNLGEIITNWYPVLGKGAVPTIPQLVFNSPDGLIQAELCPYIECDGKIEKAWFLKKNDQFDGLITVIPVGDRADILDETLIPQFTGNLKKDVVDLDPCIVYIHLLSHDKYTWTGECIVRHQECGNTGDLEFYLALPKDRLLKGENISLEFPFNSDDIDAPGVLTVRFIPAGTIK